MVQTINNTENNTSKTLSIQVSLNGLSFCIVSADHEVIALEQENFGLQFTPEQVLNRIKSTFDNNLTLKENFDTIEVMYQNDLYTLVPMSLFDENQASEYLKYNIKVLDSDFIAYDELDQHDMVMVYIPYANINNFFFDTFGSFTYKHSCTILVNSLLSKEKNKESSTVFAHMHKKYFDLVIIKNGKLMLCNTFKHDTKEDFLYYLMFTTEQMKLNPEEFELVLLGDIRKESEYYDIAYKYIRKIRFGDQLSNFSISEHVKPFESHEHFVLLSHF